MKFSTGVFSPDITDVRLTEQPDGKVKISLTKRTRRGDKTVSSIVEPPTNGEDAMEWIKKSITGVGIKLMMQ